MGNCMCGMGGGGTPSKFFKGRKGSRSSAPQEFSNPARGGGGGPGGDGGPPRPPNGNGNFGSGGGGGGSRHPTKRDSRNISVPGREAFYIYVDKVLGIERTGSMRIVFVTLDPEANVVRNRAETKLKHAFPGQSPGNSSSTLEDIHIGNINEVITNLRDQTKWHVADKAFFDFESMSSVKKVARTFIKEESTISVFLIDGHGVLVAQSVLLPEWLNSSTSLLKIPLVDNEHADKFLGSVLLRKATNKEEESSLHVVNMHGPVRDPIRPTDKVDPTSEAARIFVLPHFHTKWCDRKRQVCTAEGSVRELNRLGVICFNYRGNSETLTCEWYRSLVDCSKDITENTNATDNAAETPATAATNTLNETRYDKHTGLAFSKITDIDMKRGMPIARPDHAPSNASDIAAKLPNVNDFLDIPAIPKLQDTHIESVYNAYEELRNRRSLLTGSDLTAPWIAEALKRMHIDSSQESVRNAKGAVAQKYGEPPTGDVLQQSTSSLALLATEVEEAVEDPMVYFLRHHDVGRYIMAVVKDGDTEISTQVVGPVEAAPPTFREVWIEGQAQVGQVLRAKAYYIGGIQGESAFSWIRVSEDGSRVTMEPKSLSPGADEEEKQNVCSYEIKEKDDNCILKVACDPVRDDGVGGATVTSQPTPQITSPTKEDHDR